MFGKPVMQFLDCGHKIPAVTDPVHGPLPARMRQCYLCAMEPKERTQRE